MPAELRKILELPPASADNMEVMREKYAQLGAEPNHRRYGWIRKG